MTRASNCMLLSLAAALVRLTLPAHLLVIVPCAQAFVSKSFGVTPRPTKNAVRTLLFSSLTDANIASPVRVARHVQPSVALVTPNGVRNMTARGSGFVVNLAADNDEQSDDYMYLVTAAHVALPGYEIEATFFSTDNTTTSRVLPITVVARNVSLDLALVRAERFEISPQPLTIATNTPEVGTTAFAHGYPASRMRGPAMTSGIVCGIADGLGMPDEITRNSIMPIVDKKQATFVVTDAAMSGGMSGGPLTDDNGTVLGVNALIRPDLRALGNYAVGADEIRSFLAQAIDQQQRGDEDVNSSYRVLLYNDPMNKRERVASILKDIAVLDDGDANKVMMDAHLTGQSTIKVLGKAEAEELCKALRKQDILVEVDRLAV